MRKYDQQQIEKIQEKFGIKDSKYASLVYVFSKSSKLGREQVVGIFEEKGLPRTIHDASSVDFEVYRTISEAIDETYVTREPCCCNRNFVPGGKIKNRMPKRDLREHLQAC